MAQDNLTPERAEACTALGEQLSAYLDGELSDTERQAVEAHLHDCADCAALCRALRVLHSDIAVAELDPPPELHERIMARVRRENRLRRIRRLTVAASAGLAAMFCFVVIGGAMTRTNKADMAADGINYMAEEAEHYDIHAKVDGDVTGAVLDTTIEGDLTIVATGRAADSALTYSHQESPTEQTDPADADTVSANTTAYHPAMPAETTTETMPEPAATLPCGVMAALLPETARSLSLLGAFDETTAFSDHNTAPVHVAESGNTVPDSLKAAADIEGAQLAEVQLGSLCVVELPDGQTTAVRVFDLTTGRRLSLLDFLGSADALAALADRTALALDADTLYLPLAEGIRLFPANSTAVTLEWNADDALIACVERFAMTEPPLCAPEGAFIRK